MEQLFFYPFIISADPLCQEGNRTISQNAVQMRKLVCITNPFDYWCSLAIANQDNPSC